MSPRWRQELLRSLEEFRGDYEASKRFSSQWDARLGFKKEPIERQLIADAGSRADSTREQLWIGLKLPSLETPYPELYRLWQQLQPRLSDGFSCVDLGAAYGRVAIVQALFQSRPRFLGYELVPERAREGNLVYRSLGLDDARIEVANLAQMSDLPPADLYFVYDLGSVERIRSVLELLRSVASRRKIIVAGRGRATRNLIESQHAWLSQVESPVHFENLSLYFS